MPFINKSSSFKYKPFYDIAKKDDMYPDGYNRSLVVSVEDLSNIFNEFLNKPSGPMSFDTETSSLSPEEGSIVGFSFSFDGKNAYYVPLKHETGININGDTTVILNMLYSALKHASVVLVFNARFDLRFLRFAGYPCVFDDIKFYDVSVLCFLADSNIKTLGLKECARVFLGWSMVKFESLFKKDDSLLLEEKDVTVKEVEIEEDSGEVDLTANHKTESDNNDKIQYKDPYDVYKYASDDALATYVLFFKLQYLFKECGFICNLDNEVLKALDFMETVPTPMDKDWVIRVSGEVQFKLLELEKEIYKLAGYEFNINSSQALGNAFISLNIDTGVRTAKKQKMVVDIKVLDKIKNTHPIISKVIQYRELYKLSTSYLEPILRLYREDLGGCRFAYLSGGAPTGRFASKADKKNPFFAQMNVQAVPKPSPRIFYIRNTGYSFRDNGSIEYGKYYGWDECNESDAGAIKVEGFSKSENIRNAFKCYPEHFWVSIDFSAQELRVAANLSGDPLMINSFNSGEDYHKKIALEVFKDREYNKAVRKIAKILNFACLYGAADNAISQNAEISINEAHEARIMWWNTHKYLKMWTERIQNKGKKEGTIHTYFGRPRRLRGYYNTSERGRIAFADRTAVNTLIQGTSADLTRIAMVNIYNRVLFHPDYFGKVFILSTIHDEINLSIHYSIIDKLVPILQSIMELTPEKWKVKMETSVEIGQTWGDTIAFKYKDGILVPKNISNG